MPCSAHLWSTWRTDSMCEGKSSLKIMISSTTFCMFLIPVRASSPRRLCSSPADMSPMTLRLNRKAPHGVRNVVSFELSSSSGICQYPCLESRVVKYFDPSVIAATASRGVRAGYAGRLTYLLSPVRSTVTRGSSEFFLGTTTIGWHHVNDSPTGTFSMMLCDAMCSSCCWTDSRQRKGTWRGR